MKNYFSFKISFMMIIAVLILGFSDLNFTRIEKNLHAIRKNSFDNDGNKISKIILEKRNSSVFYSIDIFDLNSKADERLLSNFAKSPAFLKLNSKDSKLIQRNKYENILFKIPISNQEFLELELTFVSVLSKEFKIKSYSQNIPIEYKPGLYYRGIIKGDNNSIASISIFDNLVMGIASNKNGNYVLGPLKDENNNNREDYIFYNDNDLLVKNNFRCGIEDNDNLFIKDIRTFNNQANRSDFNSTHDTAVSVYFVADYQMYLDNGQNISQVANFITGFYNSVAAIYNNESIPVNISEIAVYNFPDPYQNLNSSIDILELFGANTQDNFRGDIAHLLSTGHGQTLGGIAWINVLCQSYYPSDNSGRFAFSNIYNNFLPYPVYSWTVNVVAHEMGHNLGSKHTHACAWPHPLGGIGAIDSCYTAEGNCFTITRPNLNGTIMSYCHLNGSVNFIYGFGPLPGDTIRLRYAQASCLDSALNSSEVPLSYNLLQNYPNPFNPSTTISFALPDDVYINLELIDITGREIAVLIENKYYPAGIFMYSLNTNNYSLASGVYFYKIDAFGSSTNSLKKYSETKKMVLIK